MEYGPYDIVHSHTFFNSSIVLLAAKQCKVNKCIAHAHSVKRANSNGLKKIGYFVMRLLLRKCSDGLCACSTAAGEYLFGKKFFKQRGVVVPNVIDLDKYSFSENDRIAFRNEFNISNETYVLGNVGHMLPVKNQLFLIETFLCLEKYVGKECRLVIVGDGCLKDQIKKRIKECNIEDKVILTGTRKDVHRILSGFDVFVLPSFHEGLGVSLIEATANGLYFVINSNAVADEIRDFENCIEISDFLAEKWATCLGQIRNKGRCIGSNCRLFKYNASNFRVIINDIYN